MKIDYDKLPLRYILCVDVKSFFASVEAVRRGIDPLEAYIIVVSDIKRPGAVVLASSPKVKSEFGIKTGNRKFEIPANDKLMVINPSMAMYLEFNRNIHEIFRDYAADEDIVVYSIDESII
ncbi:MAG: DNA polymerase, partial [Clostridiaceae bacterium]